MNARGASAILSLAIAIAPPSLHAQARQGEDDEGFRPSEYIRKRDEERREREQQWERERLEVEKRNRALQESREREASELERTRRELEERERKARQTTTVPPTPSENRGAASRSYRGAGELRCAARPYCAMGSGYGNACRQVSSAVTGIAEIVRLCQQANTPEPCGAHLRGDANARGNYLATFGGGCARQCGSVAGCARR